MGQPVRRGDCQTGIGAAADFDARFSATSRTYRYRVHNGPLPDPFTAHLAWHVPEELDRALLDLACELSPHCGLAA